MKIRTIRHPLLCLVIASAFLGSSISRAEIQKINLYDGQVPAAIGTHPDIDIPSISGGPPYTRTAGPVPCVIICPGGGYVGLMSTEGGSVATWWRSHGVAAWVLRYRLPGQDYPYPAPYNDVKRAVRLVRGHAAQWNINPDQIGIMGFSAGGHLASTLETHFDAGNPGAPDPVEKVSCRPDFAVLVYPVISMKDGITHAGSKRVLLGANPDPALVESLSNETQVTPRTPPTIIVRSADDSLIPAANGDLMLAALKKAGVTTTMQEYPTGGHGFGYGAKPDRSPPGWLEAVAGWLKSTLRIPINLEDAKKSPSP